MAKKITLKAGDRVAFSRAFLRSIGGDYATAQRRGTFVAAENFANLAVVCWDDFDYTPGSADLARMAEQNGDDYAEMIVKNGGSHVNINNICRVGSLAFAD